MTLKLSRGRSVPAREAEAVRKPKCLPSRLAACMTMDADRVSAVAALAREIQASMRGQIDRAGALAIAQAELEQAELEVLRVRAV